MWRTPNPQPDQPQEVTEVAPSPQPVSMFSALWGQLGRAADALLHFSTATRVQESAEAEVARKERIGDVKLMALGAERKADEFEARARNIEP